MPTYDWGHHPKGVGLNPNSSGNVTNLNLFIKIKYGLINIKAAILKRSRNLKNKVRESM